MLWINHCSYFAKKIQILLEIKFSIKSRCLCQYILDHLKRSDFQIFM
ncbi:unnamed protein product [Paramecium octaurelia]|uniref:Uncharacterized protein n=1 Tax=Paramecium octaurelia TaxID=43137 RepID=A0A8S1X5J2_PAROT|nr:unnamed protein product [Paramecium octaurelia]